jgi:hypothetical protein
VKDRLDRISAPAFATPGLHLQVQRAPPVVTDAKPEKAEFKLNWLSATGTGVLLAGVTAGLLMGFSVGELARCWWETLGRAPVVPARHRRHARAWERDEVFRHRRHARAGAGENRHVVSLLRHAAGLRWSSR